MKRITAIILTMALVMGVLVPATGVLAVTEVTPTCAIAATQICAGNIPAGGVTGGTNHGFCEATTPNEWHFIITQLSPATNAGAPPSVTAEFEGLADVIIPLEGITGGSAHYRFTATGAYLTAKLTRACGILPAGSCYNNFNLSHAPCNTTTTTSTTTITTTTETTVTTQETTEVGGNIYPVDKVGMLTPWIASAVVVVVGTALLIWRRQVQK